MQVVNTEETNRPVRGGAPDWPVRFFKKLRGPIAGRGITTSFTPASVLHPQDLHPPPPPPSACSSPRAQPLPAASATLAAQPVAPPAPHSQSHPRAQQSTGPSTSPLLLLPHPPNSPTPHYSSYCAVSPSPKSASSALPTRRQPLQQKNLHRTQQKPRNNKRHIDKTHRRHNTPHRLNERIRNPCQETYDGITFIDTKPGGNGAYQHRQNDNCNAIINYPAHYRNWKTKHLLNPHSCTVRTSTIVSQKACGGKCPSHVPLQDQTMLSHVSAQTLQVDVRPANQPPKTPPPKPLAYAFDRRPNPASSQESPVRRQPRDSYRSLDE